MNLREDMQEKRNDFWTTAIDDATIDIRMAIESYLEENDYSDELIIFEFVATDEDSQIAIELNFFPIQIDGQTYVDATYSTDVLHLKSLNGVYTFIEKIIPRLREEGFTIFEKPREFSIASQEQCRLLKVALPL